MIDLDFYIPVKDGEKVIGPCIEAILAQTLRPRRITIYLNAHSKDRTAEIIRRYPVRVREVTVPLSDARNLAIKELETEWIACVDADVVIEPDWIEKLWVKRRSGATLITGNTKERIQTVGDLFRSISSPHNWGDHDVVNPYMVVPDQLANRLRILDVGGYQTGLVNYEDADLCLRLKEAGDFFYYASDAHATHLREDDFFSVLDLRWRYSFQRQKTLLSNQKGFATKTLNNISQASRVFKKALEIKNRELCRLALFLPLHHFVADGQHLEHSDFPKGASITHPWYPSIVALSQSLIGDFVQKYWTQTIENPAESCYFLNQYGSFLYLAAKEMGVYWQEVAAFVATKELPAEILLNRVDMALTDEAWKSMIDKTANLTRKLCAEEVTRVTDLSESGWTNECVNGELGILTYRQHVFPGSQPILTCRDLTSLLASHNQRLYWTETFQGSSVISYGPLDKAEGLQNVAS